MNYKEEPPLGAQVVKYTSYHPENGEWEDVVDVEGLVSLLENFHIRLSRLEQACGPVVKAE